MSNEPISVINLITENKRLTERVDELLTSNTRLELARREETVTVLGLRTIIEKMAVERGEELWDIRMWKEVNNDLREEMAYVVDEVRRALATDPIDRKALENLLDY